ncbi:MAG: hypothetical protein ACXWYF_08760 [Actinomycetota bacterium]
MDDRRMIQGVGKRDAWDDPSPFATPAPTVMLPHLDTEGPVRFLLVSGERDDTTWGLVGAFWLSRDGERGGFLLSPDALWHGREMVRSYRSGSSRGWSDEQIFSYWNDQTGILGTYMIDPERDADTLFEVARIVGAL